MPTTAYYTNLPGTLGGPLSIRRGGQSRFVLPDMQGNVRQLTDSTGVVTDTLTTDAFGVQKATTGATVNPYKAYGQWGYFTDTPSRLYVRARELRVDLGRWISRDLIFGRRKAENYSYAEGSPVSYFDPTGLLPTCDCCDEQNRRWTIREGCAGGQWQECPKTNWSLACKNYVNTYGCAQLWLDVADQANLCELACQGKEFGGSFQAWMAVDCCCNDKGVFHLGW